MNWCDGRAYRMKWAVLAVSTRTQHRVHITTEQRMTNELKNSIVFLEKSTFPSLWTELIEFFHAGRFSTCYSMNVTQVILRRRLWTFRLDIRHAKTNGLRRRSAALVALVVNARHGERNKGTGQGYNDTYSICYDLESATRLPILARQRKSIHIRCTQATWLLLL